MKDRDAELGELAYRAHNESLGVAARDMPPWLELPDRVQLAWEIAAASVARHIRGTSS